MAFLAVTAELDDGHDDVLRRHEGEFLTDAAGDDGGVDDESLGDVLESREDDIGREECLGDRDSSVGTVPSRQIRSNSEKKGNSRVVKSPLEPLNGRGQERVLVNDHEVPREGADPLTPHGVSLVRHRTAPNLVLLERLLDLLQVGEQPDVGCDLVCRRGERGEGGEDVDVDLARVRLASDGVGILEARELGNERVERLDLYRPSVEV